jgi:hypothetical protein
MELPDLPEGWRLKSLIDITENTPCWSVQAGSVSGDHGHGEGTTPRYAFLNLIEKIENGDVYAPLSGGKTWNESVDLLGMLKIEKSEFKRRF